MPVAFRCGRRRHCKHVDTLNLRSRAPAAVGCVCVCLYFRGVFAFTSCTHAHATVPAGFGPQVCLGSCCRLDIPRFNFDRRAPATEPLAFWGTTPPPSAVHRRSRFAPPPPPVCGLNRVYLEAGTRVFCQINPMWVSGWERPGI